MFTLSAFTLQGKKAIVTGGTRGLCREIAQAYHDMGAEVVIWGSSGAGAKTAEEIGTDGAKVWFVQCDLKKTEEITAKFEESVRLLGGCPDILLNGAGIQYRSDAVDFPEEAWRNVLEVNLNALFFLSQKAGKEMCERGSGRIINMASMCSFFGSVRIPAYSASKGAVAQLTKALSNEWAGKGVTVNAIAPGYMETKLTQDIKTTNPAQFNEICARIPMGRWGKAEDLCGIAVFLASDAAAYISGAVIPVDGGYLGK